MVDEQSQTLMQKALPQTMHLLTGADIVARPVPAAKRRWMVIKTVAGALPLAVVAVWGAKHEMKQEYIIGLSVLAAVVASGQLVTAPMRDVVTQCIRLILAIRNGKAVPPSGDERPPAAEA